MPILVVEDVKTYPRQVSKRACEDLAAVAKKGASTPQEMLDTVQWADELSVIVIVATV